MKYSLLLTVGAASLLAGCSKSNDFTPAVGMNGEAIFQAACAECHEADDGGYYFTLAKTTDIGKKVSGGGMTMPAFPNIQGEALRSLEEYVAAHSRQAE